MTKCTRCGNNNPAEIHTCTPLAQHTQGRLKVQHPHAGERGWEVAFEPGLEQVCQNVTEANARRLAACWNALIDLPQEALDGGWTRAGLEAHALKMEQQRDELLEAACAVLRNKREAGWLILTVHCQLLEDAIAKVKGGAA